MCNTSALSAVASVTVPTAAQSYPNQVRADGAQLYWRYDDTVSPYVADSSVSGNTSGIQLNAPALRQTPGAVSGTSTAMGFTSALDWARAGANAATLRANPHSATVERLNKLLTVNLRRESGIGVALAARPA